MSNQVYSKIPSSYNFVPLSAQIIFPDWAKQVSHDIPFSDGLDGELEIEVEAVTPVYIRDSASKKGEKNSPEFFKCEGGKYYIPGTSLKGMVRNVLEIASYGKMQHIADKRYAMRDLQSKAYTNLFTQNMVSKVKAGFLDISTPDWKIYPCEYAMFPRNMIDPVFGNRRMAAAEKYKEYLKYFGKTLAMRADVSWIDKNVRPDFRGVPHNRAYFSPKGASEGVLVFTGQPQDFVEGKTGQKRNEFFFYDVSEKYFYVDDPETLEMDEYGDVIRKNQQDFRFVHCEQTAARDFKEWESGELKIIREKYFNGRIPIFYLKNDGVFRFGLAYLFRFAGVSSTVEALRNTSPDHYSYRNETFRPDLADLIFGYATAENSLRGRVQFSACLADEVDEDFRNEEKIILGSPKPSFYPAYLKQEKVAESGKKDDYKTFLDSDAQLRGWKRYPALGNPQFVPPEKVDLETSNMTVHFNPLPAGTHFRGMIRYHNLRPIELGALIWSLKLRNPDYYCHTIGMAKPYGYGRIRIRIKNEIPEQYEKDFQDYILKNVGKAGETSFQRLPQIEALLKMATYGENMKVNWDFGYMTDPQDFSRVKGNMQRDMPSLVLGEYPQPIPISSGTPAAPVVREKSCEEKFLEALPAKLKDCVKMLKKEEFADVKFNTEQLEQIRKKYKTELKNSYNPDAKAFNAEIEKYKA